MTALRGPTAIRWVVRTWLGTRALMALLAVWVMYSQHRTFTDVVGNWDVQHFWTIAAKGYPNATEVAFFPGWPMSIRAVNVLSSIPAPISGTVLALLASGAAAAALYRLYGSPAAIAWLLAPTAIFTMVPYTESFFCAAAFWAWERATHKHWAAAAVLAAVAMSFRVSGVFLVAALAVMALSQGGRVRARIQRLAWLVLPGLVLLGYLTYLRFAFGSWTAWYDAQASGWARGFTWPWISALHTVEATVPGSYYDQMGWSTIFVFELVSMAVGLIVTIVALARKQWAEATWVGSQVAAFSTSYWFMSVNRAVLLWFPLWEMLGRLGVSKTRLPAWRRALIWVLAVVAIGVQLWWAYRFFTGAWSS